MLPPRPVRRLVFRMQSMSESVRQDQKYRVATCGESQSGQFRRPCPPRPSLPHSTPRARATANSATFLSVKTKFRFKSFALLFCPGGVEPTRSHILPTSVARRRRPPQSQFDIFRRPPPPFSISQMSPMRRLWPSDSCSHRNYVSVGKASMSGHTPNLHLNWIGGGGGGDTRD